MIPGRYVSILARCVNLNPSMRTSVRCIVGKRPSLNRQQMPVRIPLIRSPIAWLSSTKGSNHSLNGACRKMKALLDDRLYPVGSSSPTVLFIESRETFQELIFAGVPWNADIVDQAMQLYQRVLLELSIEDNEIQKRWILDPQLLQQIMNKWKEVVQTDEHSEATLQQRNITPTQMSTRILAFQNTLPEFRMDGKSLEIIFDVVQIMHNNNNNHAPAAAAAANIMHDIMDRCSSTDGNAAIRRDMSIYKRLLQAWSRTATNTITTISEAPARMENILSRMIISERIRPDDECWNIVQEFIEKSCTKNEYGDKVEDDKSGYEKFQQRIQELKNQASSMTETEIITPSATSSVESKFDALPRGQRIQTLHALILQLQQQMKDLFDRQKDLLKVADAKIDELQNRQRILEERVGIRAHYEQENSTEIEMINGYNLKHSESQDNIHPIETTTVSHLPTDTDLAVSSTAPADHVPDTNLNVTVSKDGASTDLDSTDESHFAKMESSEIVKDEKSLDLNAYVLPKKPATINPKTGLYRRPPGRAPPNVGEWDASVGAWTKLATSQQ